MISLCIISRKEDEDALLRALESVRQYVDEIVVVDTTKEGPKLVDTDASGHGKNRKVSSDYGVIRWFPYTWNNDFAAARNFSFEKATGDVLFWIDSDDTVTNPELLPKLAKLIEDGDADWIYSRYNYHRDEFGNVDATHWKPRLFRKGSVKWEKTVHEDAAPTEGVVQVKDVETGVGELIIEHHSDTAHHEASALRNLGIMMEEYQKDGESTDPRTLQYLGMALEGLQHYPEAIEFYQKHIARSGSQSDKFWSLHRLSSCLFHLGDIKNAITVSMEGLKLYPEWQTPYLDLAALYYELGDWDKVVEWSLVAFDKKVPNILDVIDPQDYEIKPYIRLTDALLYVNNPKMALETIQPLYRRYPKLPMVKERYETVLKAIELENFVRAFLNIASEFRKYDRLKTVTLFDLIPKELDDDLRIQQARSILVPPAIWPQKSIAIFCGDSLEEWAYPSIFTGIGGSEEAVIMLSEQFAKQGWSVTVYNRCGKLKGEYSGVTYKPFYHFNSKDSFDVVISWRLPAFYMEPVNARLKLLWLHDIAYPVYFNQTIFNNLDKVIFLSKWHRQNLPELPDEKCFITNNGLNPADFKDLPEKRPNSLIWSSSYDRGLLPFIKNIWPLIKKEIPEVTLDVAYGWQNILKEMNDLPHLRELYEELAPILENTLGITHHGRISHKKLAKLMGECMVYPYASEFGETNNITSQKCQAAGCYVITTSQAGGTPERVKFGRVIKGNGIYTKEKLQRQFADAVITTLKNPPVLIRVADDFSWETTANQWIKELL